MCVGDVPKLYLYGSDRRKPSVLVLRILKTNIVPVVTKLLQRKQRRNHSLMHRHPFPHAKTYIRFGV
jgi:hypothetical protein